MSQPTTEIPVFDPKKPYKPIKEAIEFDPNKPFTPVEKKNLGETGGNEKSTTSSNTNSAGAIPSIGNVGQDSKIPKVDIPEDKKDNTVLGNMSEAENENPVNAALNIGKLKSEKQENASNAELGGDYLQDKPENIEAANKLQADLDKKGKGHFTKLFEDFPQDAFNHPETSKEQLAKLSDENPIAFQQLVNETKNQYAVKKGSIEQVINNPNYNAGNDYVGNDNEIHPQDLQSFYGVMQKKQGLIDANLSGDEKEKAHQRLEQTYSPVLNATNPELLNEYQNSDLKDKVDANQYAALKQWQIFEPEKYQQAINIINQPITKEYQDTGNSFMGKLKSTTDSTQGGAERGTTIDQAIGKESIMRQLSETGRDNAIIDLTKEQHNLENAFNNSQDDNDKIAIQQKYLANQGQINSIRDNEKQDDQLYPLTAKLKFDKQVKEITKDAGMGAFEYGSRRFASGMMKPSKSVEDIVTNMFGSDAAKTKLQMQRLGEGEDWNTQMYLPENYRGEGSPVILQPSKDLQKQADAILKGRSLSYLSDSERQQLNDLVAKNQDKIETVTNPDAGKSKNFFSKSTLFSTAGFMGDIGAMAAQSYALGGLGASKVMQNVLPMGLDTISDFHDEAVKEGKSPAEATAYGILHGGVMMLAGSISPKLDIVKRSVGINTAAGKFLSNISEDTWNKIVGENSGVLNKITNALNGTAKEAAGMTATYGVGTSIMNDLVDKGFFNKNISSEEMASHAIQSSKDLLFSSSGLLGMNLLTHSFKGKPLTEKAALWELGDNPDIGKAKIDEAVQRNDITPEEGELRKKAITNISSLISKVPIQDDKGKPMTDQKKVEYLYNLVIQDKAKTESKDLPPTQSEKVQEKGMIADYKNQLLLNPKTDKQLESRKSELEKQLEISKNEESPSLSEDAKKDIDAELSAINDEIDNRKKPLVSVNQPMEVPEPVTLVDKTETTNEQPETEQPKPEEASIEIQHSTETTGIANEKPNPVVGETEKGEEDNTSVKNEVTRLRREQLGLKDEDETMKKSFGDTWDEAKQKIDDGYHTQDLVDELARKPRPVSDVENALLLHHQNTKELELINTNKQLNDAAEKGDTAGIEEAKVRRARLLDEIQQLYDVDKSVGTETARGLSARQMMIDRKYNLVNMMAEKRAANDGQPLTPEQEKNVETLHQKIKETQDKFDEYVKGAEEEIKGLQEKILGKEPVDKKSAAQKLREWADKIDASAKGKTFSSIVPITPKMISGAMRLIADGLEKGGKVLDLIKQAIDEIKKTHPDVDEKDLSKQINKAAIESGIAGKTPETKKAKDLSGMLSGETLDRKALALKADAQRAKNEFDIALKKDAEKKKTIPQKIQNTFVKWQRAFKLTNPLTIGKLMAAGLTRMVTTPSEDIVGGVISAVAPKFSKGAIGEGGGLNVKETADAYKNGLLEGMKDSWKILQRKKEGKSDIDVVFGKSGQLPPEAIDFFGQLHSATKAPFKRFAFERSLSKRLRRNIANGVDVTDPLVQTEILMGAYKDANRAIFMQDNKVATGWQKMINYFEKPDAKTGKAPSKGIATALQWLVPFVKVPTNIAAEIGTNVYGVPVAAAKIIHAAFTKGTENLTADEKDVIVRNLKKGSLGAAALALGYFNPQTFGGYYQDKEKRDPNDAKAGSVKIGGVNIPAWLIESPIFQAMQIGATVRRVKDAKVKGEEKGLGEGLWAGALGLAEHVPMIDQPLRVAKMFGEPKERQWYLGELAKSTVDPAILQKIAEWQDDKKRNPSTIGEHIESGIPILREDVPEAGKGKSTTHERKPSPSTTSHKRMVQ